MPAHPLISIVVTSYNYARYLTECLDSALAQTHSLCEVIVIDDGSSDTSPDIIRRYGDRLKSVLKTNEGPASSWNKGFSLSTGEFVLFLDSDDVLLPTALAAALPGFDKPEVVRVQWPLIQIDAESRRTGGMIPGTELHEGNLRDALLRNGPASYMSSPTSGNLWRRTFLDQVLPVPPQFKMMCDAYLMTMSPLHGEIVALREPYSLYRTHGKNDYHGMSFLPRLERDIQSFEHRCQLLRDYCTKHHLKPDEEGWKRDSWFYRLRNVTQQLQALVPVGEKFLMVENGSWGMDKSIGRLPIPFLEHDGYYNGAPADDEMAIRELERMRTEGATFIAFGWPAFWWMEHYPLFAKYLAERYRQVIANEDLRAFELAGSTASDSSRTLLFKPSPNAVPHTPSDPLPSPSCVASSATLLLFPAAPDEG